MQVMRDCARVRSPIRSLSATSAKENLYLRGKQLRTAGLLAEDSVHDLGTAGTICAVDANQPTILPPRSRLRACPQPAAPVAPAAPRADRKSTRLNSSHEWISY